MKIEDIATPALLFNAKFNIMEFVRDKNFLSVTTRSGLKKGLVVGNIVVDCLGNSFRVLSAKKKANYYPFWKFEFFDPFIYIEMELEMAKKIDLNDVKNKVIKIISREEDEWTNYGDVEEIKRLIGQSTSYGELISTIGNFVQPLPLK
jgi:hypothetical protein